MAARMESWKGHRLLLRALEQLRHDPAWTCWIAGGGQNDGEASYERTLRDAAGAAGLGNRVRFLGQRTDVADLLAAADIYCQPNEGAEPFGISLVEALWAGLPVVTTRLGAAPEVVNESCGRLVAPADESGLASALAVLVADRGLRRELAARGPERAAALCAPARQIPAIESLFRSLLKP